MSGDTAARLGWKRVFAAVFFPERCPFCYKVIPIGTDICADCRESLPIQPLPLCPDCGQSRSECGGRCHAGYTDGIAAPYIYRDMVKDGILRFKSRGDQRSAEVFADAMAETVRREWAELTFDAISFVPMTKRARRLRDYNQSEWLAREVSRRLSLPVWNTLEKTRETRPQKSLSATRRAGNLRGVLDVRAAMRQEIKDKTILLVDDVTTTGATVSECALMLKLYGAQAVYAVTLAKTWRESKTKDK